MISRLSCSLVGATQAVTLLPDSLAFRAYGHAEVTEQFACNYGLSPEYRERISQGELRVAGWDSAGDVRLIELGRHRFFVATLFLPQLSTGADRPHPLIVAYVKAAEDFQRVRHEA